ncbi:MAG: methyltransferase domain-containing protein [Pyrinomonadaceae bacterium]|nr:methyltransferase domain-containing protein [Pyrinomonadaceae bacterium]
MQNTVERFSNRVENYVKYRPIYPPEVLQLFRDKMDLQTDSTVADIGAGTGISARIFLENGNRVFGVEPNAAMREAAKVFLKDYPDLTLVNGTSENTTLEANSIDFIVAAQAFHWFKQKETRKEFKRILKNGGSVALLWNERQLDSTAFLKDYEKHLIEFGTDYETIRHDTITKETLRDFFQTAFAEAVFQNKQTVDFDGLKGRMLSASYVPSPENPRFPAMLKNLETLFAEHAENGRIDILYDTKIFYEQL